MFSLSVIIFKGIGGKLAQAFKGDASDMKAFLGISKVLFGLQIKLRMPKTGHWNDRGPLPVSTIPYWMRMRLNGFTASTPTDRKQQSAQQ